MFQCCRETEIFKEFACLKDAFLFDCSDCSLGTAFALGFAANVFVYWQKPKLPVLCSEEDQFKAFPKPPTEPEEVKNQLAEAQLSLRRAGSLALLPLERQTNGMHTNLNCCQTWLFMTLQHVVMYIDVKFLCSFCCTQVDNYDQKLEILGWKRYISGIGWCRTLWPPNSEDALLFLTFRQLNGSSDLTGLTTGVPTMPVHAEQWVKGAFSAPSLFPSWHPPNPQIPLLDRSDGTTMRARFTGTQSWQGKPLLDGANCAAYYPFLSPPPSSLCPSLSNWVSNVFLFLFWSSGYHTSGSRRLKQEITKRLLPF